MHCRTNNNIVNNNCQNPIYSAIRIESKWGIQSCECVVISSTWNSNEWHFKCHLGIFTLFLQAISMLFLIWSFYLFVIISLYLLIFFILLFYIKYCQVFFFKYFFSIFHACLNMIIKKKIKTKSILSIKQKFAYWYLFNKKKQKKDKKRIKEKKLMYFYLEI